MSRCCLISGTSTLVIPWYHNLYQYSTGHTPIDADPLLLLPTIHPLSYTPALSPVFLMRHQPWEHLLAPGKSRADTPYADFALLLSAGENVCISIVHELGRECVCRIELRHPRGLDASTLVEHAAVMVDHFVYLVAVRYACGRVWLYEWRAGGLRDRELEGELLGFVPGAREMGFALKKVDTVREVRKTLAALVVVTGRGLVVWQCSVGRSWRSCGLAPPKREDDN